MKILIVKMSSLGDVIHTFPAITDLKRVLPDVIVHWAVEEAFVDLVRSHPLVDEVVPVAIRRWRKAWWRNRGEPLKLRTKLRAEDYDLVIDAQGLIKSALVAKLAGPAIQGFDSESARESWAANFYACGMSVARQQHAVERLRSLFSQVLGYDLSALTLSYGLTDIASLSLPASGDKKLMFLHGTTWASKHWPVQSWIRLTQIATEAGYKVLFPHGSEPEKKRAHLIADKIEAAEVLPSMGLEALLVEMQNCIGFVSVDTGLGHLAVAMDKPLVGIYGATNPALTGFYGLHQETLAASSLSCTPCMKRDCKFKAEADPPCYTDIQAERVFERLQSNLNRTKHASHGG